MSLFFEDSTRTRLSFETAAKRLSADTMTFSVSSSSVNKGESLRDTVETIDAMGDRRDGRPPQSAGRAVAGRLLGRRPSVINAGDGWHEHPTQALLDCYTIRLAPRMPCGGLRIAIVGDITHSRVARSDVVAFAALGRQVMLVAPPTLLPAVPRGLAGDASRHDLDEVLGTSTSSTCCGSSASA